MYLIKSVSGTPAVFTSKKRRGGATMPIIAAIIYILHNRMIQMSDLLNNKMQQCIQEIRGRVKQQNTEDPQQNFYKSIGLAFQRTINYKKYVL